MGTHLLKTWSLQNKVRQTGGTTTETRYQTATSNWQRHTDRDFLF